MTFRGASKAKVFTIICGLGLAPCAAAAEVDCQWLEAFVQKNSPKGDFPVGPEQVTWAVGSSPKIPETYKKLHQKYVSSVFDEARLPILFTEDKIGSRLLVFFYTKLEARRDRPRIIAELRSSPREGFWSHKGTLLYDIASLDACSFNHYPTANGGAGAMAVTAPFDRRTGRPIERAKNCILEMAFKAFGISMGTKDLGPTDWTTDCPQCIETAKNMAVILSENNKTERKPISADEMFRRLAGSQCRKD